MPDYAAQRANMVATQILTFWVTDERLLDAFRTVPREQFVPANKRDIAYAEAPIEIVPGRWLMPAGTFARLVQIAEVLPSDSILDVGCATGASQSFATRNRGSARLTHIVLSCVSTRHTSQDTPPGRIETRISDSGRASPLRIRNCRSCDSLACWSVDREPRVISIG